MESKDDVSVTSTKITPSSSENRLCKRVAELEAKLELFSNENKGLRQTNVELEVKVSSLEAKLAGFQEIKKTSSSSSSSSSSNNELRLIFDEVDTKKKGTLSMKQTLDMMHRLDLHLEEKDMLDVVSEGDSSKSVTFAQFQKMVKLSGKTISDLRKSMIGQSNTTSSSSSYVDRDKVDRDEKQKKDIDSNKSIRELSSSEIEAARKIFARYDTDKSGTISSQQAASAMGELGLNPSAQELNMMVLAANLGEKRVFHFKNFVQMIGAVNLPIHIASDTHSSSSSMIEYDDIREATDDERAKTKLLFEKFDVDKSGSIDAKELAGLLSHIEIFPTSEELSKMMELADTDNNGELDYEELVFLLSIAPKSENWLEVNGDDSDKACFKHKRTGRVVWNRLGGMTKTQLRKACPWGPWGANKKHLGGDKAK